MRRLAPFGLCGLLVLATMSPLQAAGDRVDQRPQQMRKPQQSSGGAPPMLTSSEKQALLKRLRDCGDWPIGVQNARDIVVTVRIEFNKDGSLAADPVVLNQSWLPLFQVAAEAALRGVRKCAPYTFMPQAKYENWKTVEVNFDPREMFNAR